MADGRPKRWLQCPPFGQLIDDTFLPFKTLYDGDPTLPEAYKFSPEIFISRMRELKIDIGLIINLTFSTRYYDLQAITGEYDIEHHQIFCRGHNEAPSGQERSQFIKTCSQFISKNPHRKIGVHCTHGFNRTGFMICSFLYEVRDWSIDAAIAMFASKRPPGIYKQDYINELFAQYGDADDEPMEAPEKPAWEESEDFIQDIMLHDEATRNGKSDFFEGITAVNLVHNQSLREKIYKHCWELCGNEPSRNLSFPGGHPVSMDRTNLDFLRLRPYRVSWKADGCRYMMYVQDADNVFFLARSLMLYKVDGKLAFPKITNLNENITDTLLDGEMVLDNENGNKVPRYLIYDIISLNGNNDIRCKDFDYRCKIIRDVVVAARFKAKSKNIIPATGEPFKIFDKGFYGLEHTKKTLDLKVLHEKDGLIFQPADLPYTSGTCLEILKWKPPHLNSIDFKLSIQEERKTGCLPEKVAFLYVSNKPEPFSKFRVGRGDSGYGQYNNKIVECVVAENNGRRIWKILKERVDKLHPNSYETARATLESINNPVTEDDLLNFIKMLPASR